MSDVPPRFSLFFSFFFFILRKSCAAFAVVDYIDSFRLCPCSKVVEKHQCCVTNKLRLRNSLLDPVCPVKTRPVSCGGINISLFQ